MKQIGRKIFYDKTTGDVLKIIGERKGNVVETTHQEDFPLYDFNKHGVIQLNFGDERFNRYGSLEFNLETEELIVYPRLNLVSDKTVILSDGEDTATITASIDNYDLDTIYFSVNDGDEVAINPFLFASEIEGEYTIKARSEKFGSEFIMVVVESV